MPFSDKAADRACNFFSRMLVHVTGEWAGQPFELLPWQRDRVIRPLFGTLRPDGLRQYRTCLVTVGRKSGKSTLAAGIALYLLLADNEPGGQVFGAASDRDQATIVFRAAAEMVRQSPQLRDRLKVIDSTKRILNQATGSFYRAIPADAAGSHGFDASGIIFDELHASPNRDLWDVLTTSTGARRQPLTFAISTAGYDRHSILWEVFNYARQVESGIITDPTFLPVLYGADDKDDWRLPSTWYKAIPSLGVTVSEEFIAGEARRAEELPSFENTFRRLYLSQWTEQDTRWLTMESWAACKGEVDLEYLRGRVAFGGLDLSSTTDLSAFVLMFPMDGGTVQVLAHFWLPEDSIEQRVRRDRVPYDLWARQGFITLTPGNVIDYQYIRAQVNEAAATYRLERCGVDPYNATQLTVELGQDGLDVVPVRQGFLSLNAPTKELEKRIVGKTLVHDGNPVLAWMVSNVAVEMDAAGNLKPSKSKSRERIDGVSAMVIALDQLTRGGGRSVYEDSGLLVL